MYEDDAENAALHSHVSPTSRQANVLQTKSLVEAAVLWLGVAVGGAIGGPVGVGFLGHRLGRRRRQVGRWPVDAEGLGNGARAADDGHAVCDARLVECWCGEEVDVWVLAT